VVLAWPRYVVTLTVILITKDPARYGAWLSCPSLGGVDPLWKIGGHEREDGLVSEPCGSERNRCQDARCCRADRHEIVGHSDIEVTMAIYAQVSLEETRKALRKLREALE
jgi:hypothetical protein